MYKFSEKSLNKLETCHPKLQEIFKEAINIIDIQITEGHRSKEAQDRAYHNGYSKLKWPNSKHNKMPSLAVDAVPFPIDYKDTKRFYYLAGIIKGIAHMKGISIRWGGDWNNNNDFNDNKFNDLPHYELVNDTTD